MRDVRPRTQTSYLSHVRLLGEHFDDDPANLVESQVRDYFVFLRQEKAYQPSTMNQAKAALRIFYNYHLKVDPPWTVFEDVIVRHREQLPVVISREQVSTLLSHVSEPRFHTCLSLIYTCGLRLSEALGVEVSDIDRAGGRLHVRHGKGGKARFAPIPLPMIDLLGDWWKQHRHPRFLFPAVGRRWRTSKRGNPQSEEHMKRLAMHKATCPTSTGTVQNALKWAVAAARFKQRITVHTLRHCYATHLLEDGVSIRHISAYLGHASLNQTLVYAHLTNVGEERTQAVLNGLFEEVIKSPNTPRS